MTQSLALELCRDLLLTTLLLIALPVGVSIVVGLIVSLFQTLTGIQEQTMTFAPRILAVAAVMLLTLPWTLRICVAFGQRMLVHLSSAVT